MTTAQAIAGLEAEGATITQDGDRYVVALVDGSTVRLNAAELEWCIEGGEDICAVPQKPDDCDHAINGPCPHFS